jgi:alkanesulfonate monooxygenase SsuD/methylene tetrahydromethanopterin reductase-like flavin-dependent oxidoreductase (luciferase family)
VDDLQGVLLHGTADDIVEQLAALHDSGADHVVFDFRLSFAEWEEQMQMVGELVIPQVRRFSAQISA